MAFQDQLDKLKNFDVNDLDPDNVGNWPLAVKSLIWCFVFIAVVVGTHQAVIKEKSEMLTAEQQTEDKLKADFEKKVQEAANIEKYRDQMVEMERSFSAMLSQLPKETEVPGLLNDITDKGVASGLSFKGIELKPEKKAEFYVELPIDVKVVGGYHDFGNFVSALAGLPRIVTLHDFVIVPTDKASGASASSKQAEGSDAARSSAELSMTITARTYRYKTEGDDDLKKTPKPAVPPAPAAAK